MQNEYEIKKEMCEIGRRVYNRGMVAANDGNFSVKLNDHEFLCTPTGVSKGFMTPEYICKVDENGNVLQANKGFRPSSEIKMHMRVYRERPDVQSVVQVAAECLILDRLIQVLVGRGDDTDIDRSRRIAADTCDFSCLNHPQQGCLHIERHIADLIEENRTAVGQFKLTRASLFCSAGERASLVTKELAFDQIVRDRGTINGDERTT